MLYKIGTELKYGYVITKYMEQGAIDDIVYAITKKDSFTIVFYHLGKVDYFRSSGNNTDLPDRIGFKLIWKPINPNKLPIEVNDALKVFLK